MENHLHRDTVKRRPLADDLLSAGGISCFTRYPHSAFHGVGAMYYLPQAVEDVLGDVVGPFATSGETQISEILIDSRPTHIHRKSLPSPSRLSCAGT